MSSYTREELESKNVPDLREVAREECGSGTWIAHAKKNELIASILEGRPPSEIEAEEKFTSAFAPGLEGLPVDEAEGVSHELLRLMRRVAAREVQPLKKRLRSIESRLDRLEGEGQGFGNEALSEASSASSAKGSIEEDVEVLVGEVTQVLLSFLTRKGLLDTEDR
ncbi:hypothetical protein [Salinibacter ruber]|uniref:hypothetical protein n=1 Tax=Salinibacter ruber TaxID=146919 RepID=UPI002167819C|nr:hypothetical protein [Salinibacter ruber]MCS3685791.1 tetrahydromethanopterin S-methyltransferase subunit G [Salinibacter ruber]